MCVFFRLLQIHFPPGARGSFSNINPAESPLLETIQRSGACGPPAAPLLWLSSSAEGLILDFYQFLGYSRLSPASEALHMFSLWG